MSAQDVVERWGKAQKLPPGHYEIKKAKAALLLEYGDSESLEERLLRRVPRHLLRVKFNDTIVICHRLCDGLKVRRLKFVKINNKKLNDFYSCSERTIYITPYDGLCSVYVPVCVLLHELAHHVIHMENLHGDHHEDFLWVEEMLFDEFLRLYGGGEA
jgi:hypothetical protein